MRIHQTFQVAFEYDVHFTRGLFLSTNLLLRDVLASRGRSPAKVLFVVDESLCEHQPQLLGQLAEYCFRHADVIHSIAPPLLVRGGEAVKNVNDGVDLVHSVINASGICRHSFLVAVGGGAVLDMVGYAAATAHRGIRLLRVPTTVLAQNDSGVGVKTGINRFGKKNFLGTFTPPFAVINDFDFLDSLSPRDWRSGIAEAVKVSLIQDAAFFEFIEKNALALNGRDQPAIEHLVHRCAQLHLAHIAGGDPFETGSSRPLDFGHWSAHKLEQLSSFRLRHGEAVAIGIALDATYSHLLGMLERAAWLRILNVIQRLGFDLYVPELGAVTESNPILDGLSEFREHLGGELTIMLLADIGRGVETHAMDRALVLRSIELLQNASEEHCRQFCEPVKSEDLWIEKAPALSR